MMFAWVFLFSYLFLHIFDIYIYIYIYIYILAYMGLTQVQKSYLAKQILQLLALSATACEVRTEVSPKVVGEGAGTRFPHPWDV